MRTGVDPMTTDIVHKYGNTEKDNRKELLTSKKHAKTIKLNSTVLSSLVERDG
jgi:hypothetical protein